MPPPGPETGIDRLKEDPPAVLALYRRMKQGYEDDKSLDNMVHDGHDIIAGALERIGKVKASALNRTDLKSEMEKSISLLKGSPWGFQMVVIFLHEHNMMLPPFAKMICDEFLSWAWEYLGRTTDYDCKTRSFAIEFLKIAAQEGDLPLRCDIARKIGSILVDLLKDSINWREQFESVHELLEELTGHAESRLVVYGDVPLLLQAFKELVTSEDEVEPAEVCEHFMIIFGGLLGSEEGRIAFLNTDLFEVLLDVSARGTTSVAHRCIWLFEVMMAFEDTRAYLMNNIIMYLFASSDEAKRRWLFTFLMVKVYPYLVAHGTQLIRAP